MTSRMNRRRLVEALAEVALDEVVLSELALLRKPPGRRPPMELIARSEWFLALDEDSQAQAGDVMRATAFAVLHRVLVVLDGGAALGEAGTAGSLQLLWRDEEAAVDLTDPTDSPELHDLLSEIHG